MCWKYDFPSNGLFNLGSRTKNVAWGNFFFEIYLHIFKLVISTWVARFTHSVW